MQYPAWLEVDCAQLADNIGAVKDVIGRSELCVVMKADAYGMGIANVLPTVIAENISCVAIADNSELFAIVAQQQPRYEGEIIRLRSATEQEVIEAAPYGVTELIGHLDNAAQMSTHAQAAGIKIPYHFELNSAGMGRNGLDLRHGDGREQARAILQLPGLTPRGIMTHFPKEHRDDISQSLARFREECDWLIEVGG
ncbi:alanine racemase [Suttonella sp. R2A3]|uniref:alanine racemase n=1 Tax=Suttonella sp. R2A3 TaxID=2908648 RepID=UPI001F331A94|nr:alanine racemase [Suttonella sp. R2A3]UJF25218.1 alanine racemase [Suttonella sp. R2A3]